MDNLPKNQFLFQMKLMQKFGNDLQSYINEDAEMYICQAKTLEEAREQVINMVEMWSLEGELQTVEADETEDIYLEATPQEHMLSLTGKQLISHGVIQKHLVVGMIMKSLIEAAIEARSAEIIPEENKGWKGFFNKKGKGKGNEKPD